MTGASKTEFPPAAVRRFKRILWWMAAAALLAVIASEATLYYWMGEIQIATALATGFGVFLTIMMAAGLMGLMFLSSDTGHDESVDDLSDGAD